MWTVLSHAVELYERMWVNLLHFNRTLGRSGERARCIDDGSVVASLVPGNPSTIVNNVAATNAAKLARRLPELKRAYEDAGIPRFGTWLDGAQVDDDVTHALTAAGLTLDSRPRPMGAWLDDLEGLAPDPRVKATSPKIVGLLNDLAYGLGDDRIERVLQDLPDGVAQAWAIEIDGEPATGCLTGPTGDDVGIWFVATPEPFRGRGLATALMRHVLYGHRGRGFRSTTLQGSKMGAPVYERMGYRTLGELQLWEIPPS